MLKGDGTEKRGGETKILKRGSKLSQKKVGVGTHLQTMLARFIKTNKKPGFSWAGLYPKVFWGHHFLKW